MFSLVYLIVFIYLRIVCCDNEINNQAGEHQYIEGKGHEGDDGNQNPDDAVETVIPQIVNPSLESSSEILKTQLPLLDAPQVNVVQDNIGLDWPMGVISYYFDMLSHDYLVAKRIRMTMNKLESVSCVKFKALIVKPTDNTTWIHITNPDRVRPCVHEPYLKSNGEIVLVLGLDCLTQRDLMHSLLHALGFNDEISHPQRDQYVRVLWENIHRDKRHLFRIQRPEGSSKALVEYDPSSIMHFHDRAFTRNGYATITPLVYGLQINPSNELSPLDKMKLRLKFGRECNRRKVGNLLDNCKMVLHKQFRDENGQVNIEGDNSIKLHREEYEVGNSKEDADDQRVEEELKDYVSSDPITAPNETIIYE